MLKPWSKEVFQMDGLIKLKAYLAPVEESTYYVLYHSTIMSIFKSFMTFFFQVFQMEPVASNNLRN